MKTLEIRELSADDLDSVVAIHRAALPNDVLPNLNVSAHMEYYKKSLNSEAQYLFGASLNGIIVGFCHLSFGGSGAASAFYNFRIFIGLVCLMIFKPRFIKLVLIQILESTELNESDAEISFIAVSPEYQGTGLGKQLIQYANEVCEKKDICNIQTKTANSQLKDFYLSKYHAVEFNGFVIGEIRYSQLKWSVNNKASVK